MKKTAFQTQLFCFYSKAIHAYKEKIEDNDASMGADKLMDVLFSYGIRHYRILNNQFLSASKKFLNESFEPEIEVEVIDSEMPLDNYQMGKLYYQKNLDSYLWVGSTGNRYIKRFSTQEEAEHDFSRELKYQIISFQSLSHCLELHENLIKHYVDDDRYSLIFILLHYLNYKIMSEVWDSEKSIQITNFLIDDNAKNFLIFMGFPAESKCRDWLIEYLEMKTHLDMSVLSMEHFHQLVLYTKNLEYPKSHDLFFPRFDIHHEDILMHALGDVDLPCKYQGELFQYFVELFPYLPFRDWNIQNATHLLTKGQEYREIMHKHLNVSMEDSFSLVLPSLSKINAQKYLAIMQELSPELREVFFDNTKIVFDRLSNDIEFVDSMIEYVNTKFERLLFDNSPNWAQNIQSWFRTNSIAYCEKKCGNSLDSTLKSLLFRLGYTPAPNQNLGELRLVLSHIVDLNDYIKEKILLHGLWNPSSEKRGAALWMQHILFYPQEFSMSDYKKYQQIIEKGRLASMVNSPIFQDIMLKDLTEDDKPRFYRKL